MDKRVKRLLRKSSVITAAVAILGFLSLAGIFLPLSIVIYNELLNLIIFVISLIGFFVYAATLAAVLSGRFPPSNTNGPTPPPNLPWM